MKTLPILLLMLAASAFGQTGPDKYFPPMRKFGGSQLVRVKEREATFDEIQAYFELNRRVPAHLISEVSCYMPDYLKEFYINGKRMPGAPMPSAYCWERFRADCAAGKKVPLHLRYIDNYNKAQEQFFKDNPGARPDTTNASGGTNK